MSRVAHGAVLLPSRSPSGERGLKYFLLGDDDGGNRRSPSGERGLKYESEPAVPRAGRVAPHPGSVD